MTQKLVLNGQTYEVDVPPDMPLLWVIRDVIGLTGTSGPRPVRILARAARA